MKRHFVHTFLPFFNWFTCVLCWCVSLWNSYYSPLGWTLKLICMLFNYTYFLLFKGFSFVIMRCHLPHEIRHCSRGLRPAAPPEMWGTSWRTDVPLGVTRLPQKALLRRILKSCKLLRTDELEILKFVLVAICVDELFFHLLSTTPLMQLVLLFR